MSYSEYQSIVYGYNVRKSQDEVLFRSLWVQMNNVNAIKKSQVISKPEKYWHIPLADYKPIKVPTKEEKEKAYELAKQWQNLNFEEEAKFDSISKTIR